MGDDVDPEEPAPRIRVLVVDDDAGMRRMLRRVLDDAGYEVLEAANGALALDAAAAFRPALVVTDLRMPVMNGRELVDRLRADAATESIVILVMTAEAAIPLLGAHAAIAKPFNPRQLLTAVRSLTAPGS
jgi:two-component system cell cycle response regulator DivK